MEQSGKLLHPQAVSRSYQLGELEGMKSAPSRGRVTSATMKGH